MTLSARLLRKVLRVPQRLFERLEQQRKAAQCVLGADAVLDPRSRIENLRDRDAICIGDRTTVLGECVVYAHGGQIQIGRECFIGEHSRLWSSAAIRLGDRVLVSHNVNIHDGNAHSLFAELRNAHVQAILRRGHPSAVDDVSSAPVTIHDDVWIGFNATVLKGVTIGRGAVVGACAVVTKDVPAYTIVVGNPARAIGQSRP